MVVTRFILGSELSPRYFFMVEEDNTPLSVTVTPCDAPLEWKLSLQELPEEGSADGSGKGQDSPSLRAVKHTAFCKEVKQPCCTSEAGI